MNRVGKDSEEKWIDATQVDWQEYATWRSSSWSLIELFLEIPNTSSFRRNKLAGSQLPWRASGRWVNTGDDDRMLNAYRSQAESSLSSLIGWRIEINILEEENCSFQKKKNSRGFDSFDPLIHLANHLFTCSDVSSFRSCFPPMAVVIITNKIVATFGQVLCRCRLPSYWHGRRTEPITMHREERKKKAITFTELKNTFCLESSFLTYFPTDFRT